MTSTYFWLGADADLARPSDQALVASPSSPSGSTKGFDPSREPSDATLRMAKTMGCVWVTFKGFIK